MGNLKVHFFFRVKTNKSFSIDLPLKNFDTKFVNFHKIRQFKQNYRETQDTSQSTFGCNGNN